MTVCGEAGGGEPICTTITDDDAGGVAAGGDAAALGVAATEGWGSAGRLTRKTVATTERTMSTMAPAVIRTSGCAVRGAECFATREPPPGKGAMVPTVSPVRTCWAFFNASLMRLIVREVAVMP